MALRSAPRKATAPKRFFDGSYVVPSQHGTGVLEHDAPNRRIKVGVDPQRAALQQCVPGVRSEELGHRFVGHLTLYLLEYRLEEILLAIEVMVERAFRHSSTRDDLIGAGVGVTRLPEELPSRNDEGGPGASPWATRLSLTIKLSVCIMSYH